MRKYEVEIFFEDKSKKYLILARSTQKAEVEAMKLFKKDHTNVFYDFVCVEPYID